MKTSGKIVKIESLLRKLALLRKQKKIIAFTNGCFDILHFGHVSYLEKAKSKDRILIVGVNSDDSVRVLKGAGRPVNRQESRASVLAALACVDFVVVFSEDTPYHLIQRIKPDVLIKGADYKKEEIAGADILKSYGGRVELIPFVKGFSTTKILKSAGTRA